MRYLGIDFGLKRVGLALSDSQATVVTPLATVQRSTRQALFEELLAYIETYAIEAVVIGLPYDLEGTATLTTRQARNFGTSLARRIALPIYYVDEVLTSEFAGEALREAGVPRHKRKDLLDQHAAVAILESFLASGPANTAGE
ncbi:Holliday junction resolvase RuvX [Desulfohalobium retbaense]|uniref:Putative pre-16S rRNA nuclease n=1 Tax=Desulfohalobium retbaense (strain ATCC 49708 / DSM 5692 / JCM 16813 / HR100) TaxID=485915 RepID=C8X295_DESRD|nr:Holliday junction resolvase RuvX [Desulfohalobium retbaense]ACV68418.1 Holliday junction resolvase YqgF [Desulfohalobium retbaense DSM 5692]